jgi:hypothetical protein
MPSWVVPAILCAGVVLAVIIRLRLLAMPLDRDEGEFGYMAQLMLRGDSCLHAYNYKLPGVSSFYALFMLAFGQTDRGIHQGLLLVNLATITVLYLLARRWFSPLTAAAAGLVYAFMSVDPALLGTAALAEHFVSFFALLGLWLLEIGLDKKQRRFVAGAGVAMGLAFTMKQPAIYFGALGLALIGRAAWGAQKARHGDFLRDVAAYGIGAALPLLVIIGYAAAHGELGLLVKWKYTYPRVYGGLLTWKQSMEELRFAGSDIRQHFGYVYALAGIGMVALGFSRPSRRMVFPMFGLLVASLLAVAMGRYFRNHYFLMLLPWVVMQAGFLIQWIGARAPKRFARVLPVVLLLAASLPGVIRARRSYFLVSAADLCTRIYPGNFFTQGPLIGKWLREKTSEDDQVAIFGSEAELYFYSRRKAATGYLFVDNLVRRHRYAIEMQEEMIKEVASTRPKAIVVANSVYSWLVDPEAPNVLMPWMSQFVEHYELVGIVARPDPQHLLIGPDAESCRRLAGTYDDSRTPVIQVLLRP